MGTQDQDLGPKDFIQALYPIQNLGPGIPQTITYYLF